jgi:hypothetical protein
MSLSRTKRLALVAALAVLIVLAATGIRALMRGRLSLVRPGGETVTSRPIAVEIDPELAREGLTCHDVGTAVDVETVFVFRYEKARIILHLSGQGGQPADLAGLHYELLDADLRPCATGRLDRHPSRQEGGRTVVEIDGPAVGAASTVRLRRR